MPPATSHRHRKRDFEVPGVIMLNLTLEPPRQCVGKQVSMQMQIRILAAIDAFTRVQNVQIYTYSRADDSSSKEWFGNEKRTHCHGGFCRSSG